MLVLAVGLMPEPQAGVGAPRPAVQAPWASLAMSFNAKVACGSLSHELHQHRDVGEGSPQRLELGCPQVLHGQSRAGPSWDQECG